MTHRKIFLAGALLMMVAASMFTLMAGPGATAAPTTLIAAKQCIPCSASHPCDNPLTVCSIQPGKTHGCCIGYAP